MASVSYDVYNIKYNYSFNAILHTGGLEIGSNALRTASDWRYCDERIETRPRNPIMSPAPVESVCRILGYCCTVTCHRDDTFLPRHGVYLLTPSAGAGAETDRDGCDGRGERERGRKGKKLQEERLRGKSKRDEVSNTNVI